MRTTYSLWVTVLLVLSLGACASIPHAPQTINVSMDDYGFKLTPDTLRPGEVSFVIKNDATSILHQMMIVKTYLPADQLPDAVEGQMISEGTGIFTKVGAIRDLDPGKTTELRVTLDPGHYVYFCNTPTHYRMGMYGEFTVAP